MDDSKQFRTTTFQITPALHSQLKIMCMLTNKSMGEFIRLSIRDKIKEMKDKETVKE